MNVSDLISRYLDRKANGKLPPDTQQKIAAALHDRCLRSFDVREEDHRVHVADIANGCPRAVWNRLNHGVRSTFDAATRKKFEYGFRYEDTVLAALLDAGYEPVTNKSIDFGDVVGHPDLELYLGKDDQERLHLIEVKTTMLFRNGPGAPQHPPIDILREKQAQYVFQACYYAKALSADKFTVHVSDRGTGIDADYEFDTRAEWPATKARYDAIMAGVNGTTEPLPEPPIWTRNAKGSSYLCRGGCPVVTCSQNANYTPQLI